MYDVTQLNNAPEKIFQDSLGYQRQISGLHGQTQGLQGEISGFLGQSSGFQGKKSGFQGQMSALSAKTCPLYVDVGEASPLMAGGYSNGLFMKRSERLRHQEVNKGHVTLSCEEMMLLRGEGVYDDMDLLSECSTPRVYSPGRFLQLHDDVTDLGDDVTLWPVSRGEIHSVSKHPTLIKSPKFFLPLLLCVFLAFSMLGGLMTVLT